MTSKIFRSTVFVAVVVLLCSLGIVIGVAAAAVGGYFLFTKFLKDKLCKKKACDQIADEACDCCEETCDACEEIEEIIEDVDE